MHIAIYYRFKIRLNGMGRWSGAGNGCFHFPINEPVGSCAISGQRPSRGRRGPNIARN